MIQDRIFWASNASGFDKCISIFTFHLCSMFGVSTILATWCEELTHWKTLMVRKIEGRRRSGWQRMRWLDGIINSMDTSMWKLWVIVKDREARSAAVHEVTKIQAWLSDWITNIYNQICSLCSQISPHSFVKTLFSKAIYQLNSHPMEINLSLCFWAKREAPIINYSPLFYDTNHIILHAVPVFCLFEA